MNIVETIYGRRSIRAYETREPDHNLIEALIWDAAQAPPPAARAAHRLAFVVVVGSDRLAKMGERAKAFSTAHRPPGGGSSWIDNPDFKFFWNAPTLIVICAARDLPETDWDCCRAAQNLMLSAYSRGLGSCWVGAPLDWLRSEPGSAEAGIPDGFEAVAPILIGWPQVTPPPREVPRPLIVWRTEP